MPTRRSFLGALLATGAASGCLGYEVVQSDEAETLEEENRQLREAVSAQQDEIERLESDRAELVRERNERNETIERLEQERNESVAERQQLEEQLVVAGGDRLLSIYQIGFTGYTNGDEAQSSGNDQWNARNYSNAAIAFARGEGYFEHAVTVFEDVMEDASEEDESEAVDAASDAREYCDLMRAACAEMAAASGAMLDGQAGSASNHFTTAWGHRGSADDYGVVSPDQFESIIN